MNARQLDQYHAGESGSVFDGHVEEVTFGWTPETCRAVSEACRFSHLMGHLDSGQAVLLRQAASDLDYRCALVTSRDRHPASTTR